LPQVYKIAHPKVAVSGTHARLCKSGKIFALLLKSISSEKITGINDSYRILTLNKEFRSFH
jgi:hypothetical protein